jgi:predicted ester cyclase
MTAVADTERTLEVAGAYFEAIAAQDLDAQVALWKAGALDRFVGLAELTAPDEIRAWFAQLWSAFPDAKLSVIEQHASGEHATTRWSMAATFSGAGRFLNLEPNGAAINIEGCDVTEVQEGQIVANHAYLNGAELARQLGVLPAEGSLQDRAVTSLVNSRTIAARWLRERREA